MKVKADEVTLIEPGTYWWNDRWSEVFMDNVRTKTIDLADQLLTTSGDTRVRVGGVLEYSIANIETWLIDNEDSPNAILTACARVLRDYVVSATFADLQTPSSRLRRDDTLTRNAQKELGAKFGARIHHLGLSTFAETSAFDLYHAGDMPGVNTPGEEE